MVVDVQERFAPVILDWDNVISNVLKAVKSFQVLGIPIIVTEQYPKGLGLTDEKIRSALTDYRPLTKLTFSCMDSVNFKNKIHMMSSKTIILVGIEAHICLLNTALDLIDSGYAVHVVADAVSSRKEVDRDTAFATMAKAGVVISTVETIVFQLLIKASDVRFKEIQTIIK